jgi:NtrC-family two-component system sensor histidine kinase KinB
MGLRAKILSGFLILAVMLLVAGVWSIHELRSVGASVQKILDDNYKSINAAKTMIQALERMDSAVLLLLSGNWEEGRPILAKADTTFQRAFEVAQNNVTIKGERDLLDRLGREFGEYKALWQRPIVGTQHERDINWYFKELHTAFLQVKSTAQKVMTINDKVMYETATDLKTRAHRAAMPGIIAIISAFVFTLMFNYFVNSYMVNPVIKMKRAIADFLDNDTAIHLEVRTRDELGDLADYIQRLSIEPMLKKAQR